MRWLVPCALGAMAAVCAPARQAAAGDFLTRQRRHERVARAYRSRMNEVRAAFVAARAAWPPRIFLRAFKDPGVLELWAAPARGAGGRWVLVRSFALCASSGTLGPKRRAGDGQIPEGFYHVDRFNPRSSYHLSLGIDYPNAVDRKRAGDAPPGGDIFIHGGCETIGCLPLGDAPVEALYLAVAAARDGGQRRLPVHIFPCRLERAACRARLRAASASDPALGAFWRSLLPGYERFADEGRPPRVRASAGGGYQLVPSRNRRAPPPGW